MTLRTYLDGAVFAEHVAGDPPQVLVLHGWGRDRHDLLGALVGHEVVSLDLPGFGASPPPPGPWGASEYAAAAAEVVRELATGPVVVLGHSFGGRVAVCLGAAEPELVSGVVLTGVPLLRSGNGGSRPALAYRAVRRARRMRVVPERVLDRYRRRHGSADYNAASGIMREVLVRVVNEDYSAELEALQCPVAMCWGAQDSAAPVAVAEQAAAMIGHLISFDVIEGVGHDVAREAPDRLAAALDEVVRKLS